MDAHRYSLQGNQGVQIGSSNTMHVTIAGHRPTHLVIGGPPTSPPRLFGRDQEMEVLRDFLAQDAETRLVVLGQSGVGKTSLVARVWTDYTARGQHGLKLWMDATTMQGISSAVLDLAEALYGKALDYPAARACVRAELARFDDVVIVADNAVGQAAVDELGAPETTKWLLTSKSSADVADSYAQLNIEPLTREHLDTWVQARFDATRQERELLLDHLSGFPVIAERVLGTLQASGYPITEFVRVLQSDSGLTDGRLFLARNVAEQYRFLASGDPLAAALVGITALARKGPMPVSTLKAIMPSEKALTVIANARRSGLVATGTDAAIAVHDEVSSCIATTTAAARPAAIIRLVLDQMTAVDLGHPGDPARWPAHAASTELSRRLLTIRAKGGRLRSDLDELIATSLDYLRHRGLTSIHREMVEEAERVVTRNRPAWLLNNKVHAMCDSSTTSSSDLEAQLNKLDRLTAVTGTARLKTVHAQARGLWRLGRYRLASDGITAALENVPEPDTSDQAWPLVELLDLRARVDRERSEYGSAIEAVREASRLSNLHSLDFLHVGLSATEGVLLLDTGRLSEADELLSRTLTANERSWGADHPRTALLRNNLGIVAQEQGNLERAETLFVQALSTNRKIHGETDGRVAANLLNIGNVRLDQGRHQDALAAIDMSIRIRSLSIAAQQSWAMGIAVHNYAYALFCAGHHHSALAFFHQALTLKKQSLLDGDPRILSTRCGLIRTRIRTTSATLDRSTLHGLLDDAQRKHPDHRVVRGLLHAALADSYWFDDQHPSHREHAQRALELLRGWGGRGSDKEHLNRLASS